MIYFNKRKRDHTPPDERVCEECGEVHDEEQMNIDFVAVIPMEILEINFELAAKALFGLEQAVEGVENKLVDFCTAFELSEMYEQREHENAEHSGNECDCYEYEELTSEQLDDMLEISEDDE